MKKVLNFAKKFIGNTVQSSVPGLGTLVTVFKSITPKNPKGKFKPDWWDVFRIVLGIGVLFGILKGWFTLDQIKEVFKWVLGAI